MRREADRTRQQRSRSGQTLSVIFERYKQERLEQGDANPPVFLDWKKNVFLGACSNKAVRVERVRRGCHGLAHGYQRMDERRRERFDVKREVLAVRGDGLLHSTRQRSRYFVF